MMLKWATEEAWPSANNAHGQAEYHSQETGHQIVAFFWDIRCLGCDKNWVRAIERGDPFNPNSNGSSFCYAEITRSA